MLRGKVKFLHVIAVCLLILCLSLPAWAQEIKMSYNGPADIENNAVHLFATNFKKMVEEESAGSLKISLYPDSQLGNEEERMELLAREGMNQPIINIASFGGIAPLFPEIYATAVPFMFNSYKAAHIFFDQSRFWKQAQEEFKKRTGAVLLEAIEEGGFLAFTNSKRGIRSPQDFEGLKFRGMDEGQITLYKAFGASGTPIPWTELYMALKTGVVDGQMNPAMYIKMGSLYEVQKHLTLANSQYSDQFLVINGDLFDSLSEDNQHIVLEAAKKANAMNREAVEAQDSKDVQFLSDHGMQVYTPNEEEMNAFREKALPAYHEWLKTKVSKEWLDLALECAKNANAAASK